ncbi:hypothetical protein GGR51DRAFT_160910 [Nemania sp. FL0031]|nr:hypothetical protein GGR51DRAFT_160910 [Nemania sp. FL0031]
MKRRTVVRSAQYGQACQSCTKAKCRCVLQADGNGCERCHRLKKACQPSGPVRRRNTGDEQRSGERIAFLERKLESLVSQLQSRQILGDGAVESQEPLLRRPEALLAEPSSPVLHSNATREDDDVNPLAEASGLVAAPIATGSEPADNDKLFTTCLDIFTSSMLPYFPIISFPPGITVERLRCDRPLLLRAIGCVAWPFPREKRTRALELKRTLLEAAFLRHQDEYGQSDEEADSSTDLLLALLTYIAWGWDHIHGGDNLSYLMMPCTSLVGGMFLDRPAPHGLHTANIFALHSKVRRDVGELSSERRRALLGCFVLSSIISSFFASIDAMSWTSQMEAALATLCTSQECPGDAVLVLQARLQLLSLETTKIRRRLQEQSPQTQPALLTASVTSDAGRLLEQLQELRKSDSTPSKHNRQVSLAYMSYVEMQVLEIIRASSLISSKPGGETSVTEPRSNDEGINGPRQDISSLGYSDPRYILQSMIALGACTSALLDIPPSRFVGISFIQWGQLLDCLVVLCHPDNSPVNIINHSSPGIIDIPALLDRIIEKLTLAAVEALEEDNGSTFTLLASHVGALRSRIPGLIVEANQPGLGDASGSSSNNPAPVRPFRPSQGPFQNPKIWIDQLFAA